MGRKKKKTNGEAQAIADGRALERKMTRYAQDISKSAGVRFGAAIEWMHEHAATVAKDMGGSEAFVKVWAEAEMRRAATGKV
jgi:hypothetical protein